jgi:hypothetical protein
MVSHKLVRAGFVLLLASVSIPLLSQPQAASSLKKSVSVASDATVAGKALKAGDYTLVVKGTDAKFEQDGKVVADVTCTWDSAPSRLDYDSLLVSDSKVVQFQEGGTTTEIDFGQ